jgi:hypothetical protein
MASHSAPSWMEKSDLRHRFNARTTTASAHPSRKVHMDLHTSLQTRLGLPRT